MKDKTGCSKGAQLALDCELVTAVNKIVWKNIHRGLVGLHGKLSAAGFAATFQLFSDHAEFEKTVSDLSGDIKAAKEVIFFLPPPGKRRAASKELLETSKSGRASKLLFVGRLDETDFPGTKRYTTVYAIFRKPKTNRCVVALLAC